MADVKVHRFGHRKSGLYTMLMLPERPFCRSGLPDRACGRSSRSFLRVWWDRGMRHLCHQVKLMPDLRQVRGLRWPLACSSAVWGRSRRNPMASGLPLKTSLWSK
jgi:hypothetical protein